DDGVRPAPTLVRDDGGHATTRSPEARHRGVLTDTPAQVLERPRVGLDGPLGIGVAAEVEVEAAGDLVSDDGDQLAELLGVERLRPEAALRGDLGVPSIESELALGEGHLDPVRGVLRRVAEQGVHLGPEPLLLETEGAVAVGASAAG